MTRILLVLLAFQNLHPKAPPGSLQRVIFDDAIEGTKGLKRVPGPEDLWWLE